MINLRGSIAILLLVPFALHSQCLNPNLPTSASTRALALGDANTAGRDDDVIFYGPAQLAVARGTSAAVERYGEHLTSGTIASTSRLASGGVGVGVSFVNGRNVGSCTEIVIPSSGSPFVIPAPENYSRTIAAVGVAQTYKRFRVGATAKYASRQSGDDRASHLIGDVGVARDVSVADNIGLGIALAVQNVGVSPADAVMLQTPLRGALGLSTGAPVGPLDVVAAAQVAVEQHGAQSITRHGRVLTGGGIELGYVWLDGYSIALRAGARSKPLGTDLGNLTAGVGLVLDRIAIDYAAEALVGSRLAHRLGVRLR